MTTLTNAQQPAAEDSAPYVAVTGPPGTGKTTVLGARQEAWGGELVRASRLAAWCATLDGFPIRGASPLDPGLARELFGAVAREVALEPRFAELPDRFDLPGAEFGTLLVAAAMALRGGCDTPALRLVNEDDDRAGIAALHQDLAVLRRTLVRRRWTRRTLPRRDRLLDLLLRATSPEALRGALDEVSGALAAVAGTVPPSLGLRIVRLRFRARRLATALRPLQDDPWSLLAEAAGATVRAFEHRLASQGWRDHTRTVTAAIGAIDAIRLPGHLLVDDAQELLSADVRFLGAVRHRGVRLSLAGDPSVAWPDPSDARPAPLEALAAHADARYVLREPLRYEPALADLVSELERLMAHRGPPGGVRLPGRAAANGSPAAEIHLVERGVGLEGFLEARHREAETVAVALRRFVAEGLATAGNTAVLVRTMRYLSIWEAALGAQGLPQGTVQVRRIEDAAGWEWETVVLAELDDHYGVDIARSIFDPRSGLFAARADDADEDKAALGAVRFAVRREAAASARRLFRLGVSRARRRLVLSGVTRREMTPSRDFKVPIEWLRQHLGAARGDPTCRRAALGAVTVAVEWIPTPGDPHTVEHRIA